MNGEDDNLDDSFIDDGFDLGPMTDAPVSRKKNAHSYYHAKKRRKNRRSSRDQAVDSSILTNGTNGHESPVVDDTT